MLYGWPRGFQWDADKAEANVAKHGIDFVEAVRIFDGIVWDRVSIRMGELRILATGAVGKRELTVTYTIRGMEFRIISARRASARERRQYRALLAWRASGGGADGLG